MCFPALRGATLGGRAEPLSESWTGVGAPADDAIPTARADDSNDWMRGFHGAIVSFDGKQSIPLRQLAMSRKALGLGRIESLVALPGEPTRVRVPPQTAIGARRAAARNGATPVSGQPVAPRSGDPAEESQFNDLSEPGSSSTGGGEKASATSVRELDRRDAEHEESLPAFLDRRLADARYLLLPNRSRAYAVTKRAVDLIVATAMLVAFSPVMVALVVLIRLDSPGPAIFRQDRVTRGGRIFRFYKFRTMYADARERFPDLYDYRLSSDEFESSYYKLTDDPRNTRVGRWLRRTTLDELPNLLNVIKGDLSLVGPRPDLPEFVRLYRPEELCCLFAKAGVTGVAQVAGRSLLTVRERLTLDMRYISQQTLLLDLQILWRTAVVVLSGRGAF